MRIRGCPLPAALYSDRRNSRGVDLGNPPRDRGAAPGHMQPSAPAKPVAGPIINGILLPGSTHAVTNPADRREQVGSTRDATPAEIARAFDAGAAAQPAWDLAGRGAARGPAREGVRSARSGPRGFSRAAGA